MVVFFLTYCISWTLLCSSVVMDEDTVNILPISTSTHIHTVPYTYTRKYTLTVHILRIYSVYSHITSIYTYIFILQQPC